MQKTTAAPSPFELLAQRYQERQRIRSQALTAVNVGLVDADDVLGACAVARAMAERLCFRAVEADGLAAGIAAAGGTLVAAGGRGGALVSDASDERRIRLLVTIEARAVSLDLIEAALLRRLGPWRRRPAPGLPAGPFHWDASPVAAPTGARVFLTLWRPRSGPTPDPRSLPPEAS